MSRTSRRSRETGRKEFRDGKAHGWNMTTPSWWNNLLNHRSNRRQARLAERLAALNPEAAGDLLWPLSHKPHLYFWRIPQHSGSRLSKRWPDPPVRQPAMATRPVPHEY